MSCKRLCPAESPKSPPPGVADGVEQVATSSSPQAKPRLGARGLPKGLRLLVIEHNTIFALDAEDMLLRHGVQHVTIANSAGEALAHLHKSAFDAALLDLKLPGSSTLEVALCLQHLGVPFAFAIGYGERAELPERFSEKMVIGKPYSEPYLIGRLTELLTMRG